MKIYLVGYMYSGKTTIGRQLAQRLGLKFVDTDQLFEQKYRLTIPLFLAKYDQALFRKLEGHILRSTAEMNDVVVATGGGTPCYEGGMEWMMEQGLTVHIKIDVEGALLRHSRSQHTRPLLQNMSEEERRKFVEKQIGERMVYYAMAQYEVDAMNPDLDALLAQMI